MTNKGYYLVLLALTTVEVDGDFELRSYVRNWQHLCPFTNYCSLRALRTGKDVSCCSECSCDSSSCYQTNSCCPDIEPTPHKESDLICADTMTKFMKHTKPKTHNGFSYGIKRYFIVASCPKDYNDDFVDSKCRGINKTDLNDYLWVSDLESDIIYQNYHCAKCHDVEDWVTWNFRSSYCFVHLLENNFQNISATLLSDLCEIINVVPKLKTDVSRRYRCFLTDYDSCNQTGRWVVYDPDYETACNSFTQIYFKPDQIDTIRLSIYKNVFCWLCNNSPTIDIPTLCPNLDADPVRDLFPSPSQSLSALIDFNVLDRVTSADDTINRSHHCSMVQMFDEYMGQCRMLECPLGSLPVNGVCKQVITDIVHLGGLEIMYIVNIKYNWSEIADNQVAAQFGETIADKIESHAGLHTCGNCSVEVKNYSNAREDIKIRVWYNKMPTNSCQLDHIHKGVLAVSGKDLDIQLTSRIRLTAVATIAEKSDYDIRGGQMIFLRDNKFTYCDYKNRLHITEPLCPRIQVAFSEALKLEHGKRKKAFLTFFENFEDLNETTIVGVCIEDYNTVMRQNSESTIRRLSGSAVIIIFLRTITSLV